MTRWSTASRCTAPDIYNTTSRTHECEASRTHGWEASGTHECEASRTHGFEASGTHGCEAGRIHGCEAGLRYTPLVLFINGGAGVWLAAARISCYRSPTSDFYRGARTTILSLLLYAVLSNHLDLAFKTHFCSLI